MRKEAGRSDAHLTNAEIQKVMGCEKSKASRISSTLNRELQEKGYMTMCGKVPIKYFAERFGFDVEDLREILGKNLITKP